MTSYDICLWLTSVPQIDGETMETMTDIFRGSKITVDGDCSHEIKRCLLLGRKAMTNRDSIFGEGNGTPLQYSCLENPMDRGAWWAAVHGVTTSGTRLSDFTFTFHFHALEKAMATHSSVLAWRIPGTGESGGLPSMGSHRVRHDWRDLAAAAAADSILKSRDYFANKGPSGQSYGFSSGHVWMWVGLQGNLSAEELMLLNCGAGEHS